MASSSPCCRSYPVDRPEVVPFDSVACHFPDARAIRTFGVTEAVLLHEVGADLSEQPLP